MQDHKLSEFQVICRVDEKKVEEADVVIDCMESITKLHHGTIRLPRHVEERRALRKWLDDTGSMSDMERTTTGQSAILYVMDVDFVA